ncbi:MAG TPA: SRPBCC domain-containing protein [Ktedonobacterales bacterium]|nr:SRPBCC domain-containing protein [Ktedonobacterales bacterium]
MPPIPDWACGISIRKGHNRPMEISGTHRFAAPRQAVWDALHNGAVLQKCIPGAEEVSWQGENAVRARVHIGIGPINGTFGGQVDVLEHTAPSHLKLALTRSIIDAQATIDLADEGAGSVATYSGTAKLAAGLAMLDNPVGRQMAQGALNQFFKNFEQAL